MCVCEENKLLTSFAGVENTAVATSISMEASAVTSFTGCDEVAASIVAAAVGVCRSTSANFSIGSTVTFEDASAEACMLSRAHTCQSGLLSRLARAEEKTVRVYYISMCVCVCVCECVCVCVCV